LWGFTIAFGESDSRIIGSFSESHSFTSQWRSNKIGKKINLNFRERLFLQHRLRGTQACAKFAWKPVYDIPLVYFYLNLA
jgi:hypothetical protein